MSELSRPKLRRDNQPASPQKNQGNHKKPTKKKGNHKNEPLPPRSENAVDVPVMFRAQIKEAHGSLQFSGKVKDSKGQENREDLANLWVQEWLEPWQASKSSTKELEKPKTQIKVVLQRFQLSKPHYSLTMPTWDNHIHTWKYQLSWRLVTNSGQEPDLIRPVFGARGVPYYPGSSMKGAFAQACANDKEKRNKYCGQEVEENGATKTKPGLLRFHGGYPIDTTWADDKALIDVIHPQQNRQVETEIITSAKKQISLHQTILCFGISSNKPNETDWDEVQAIWEKALTNGLGGRTSAGYGQVSYRIEGKKKIPLTLDKPPLLSVYLSGQGIKSKLLNGEPEFRPNIFKAALRGHTLRLFSGFTNEKSAKQATANLWGDIDKEAIFGQLGIRFFLKPDINQIRKDKNADKSMPLYQLTGGRLDLCYQAAKTGISEIELEKFSRRLIQFTLLLGGFGKSWRRVDHNKFSHQTYLPNYFKDGDKAPIGCHWEFSEGSYDFYLDTSDWMKTIPAFLTNLHQQVHDWLVNQKLPINGYERTWRESWHPENVQVWGRLANGEEDCLAIVWLHGDYKPGQKIKGTFAGKMGKIGRVWHRMYPQYIQVNGEWQATKKYIELLTIFPRYENTDDLDKQDADQFVQFLKENEQFTNLWGQ